MKLQELYDILRNTRPESMIVGIRRYSSNGQSPINHPIHTFVVENDGKPENLNAYDTHKPIILSFPNMDMVPTTVECLANHIEGRLAHYGQNEVFVRTTFKTTPGDIKVVSAGVCSDGLKFNIEYEAYVE